MYCKVLSYSTLLLSVLATLMLALGGCSDLEAPNKLEADVGPQPIMGMMYIVPADAPHPDFLLLSSNQFVNWQRYPAEEQTWLVMTGETAYYRDVLVGGQTYISAATDGETWFASAVRPDGMPLNWGAIKFYSEYDGHQNCFVSPFWVICNTTSLYILWYTNAQCVEPGQWTMQFFNNGMQFHEGTFKVLPQIPPGKVPSGPVYNQLAYSDHYDNRCWKTGSSPRRITECDAANTDQCTIAQLGCWLTSSCMILGYHGVAVDPPTLNAYLNANGGYISGDVDGYVVAKYARAQGKEVYYHKRGSVSDLTNLICSRGPQMAHVRKPGRTKYHHFVVATGKNEQETTYLINDPAGGSAIELTDKYQDMGSIRIFEGPEYVFKDNLCGITIRFHSPGELLMTDPEGRRTGVDPIAGQSYNEIPNDWYEEVFIEDPLEEDAGLEFKTLELVRPVTGDYHLAVTGTGYGSYDLAVRGYDIDGGQSNTAFEDIPIMPDAVHSYALEFDNTPGSEIDAGGGFDGGGQRPRDVNKFLSYGTISSSRVELPPGTSSFALLVMYGETIIPGSFEADLDRVDVTGLFSPAAGTSEIVEIPLQGGRAVLKLTVQGDLPSRTARDTDRIVFLVTQ